MKNVTFILSNLRTFRREVAVFIKNKDGKFEKRSLPFTTEHKVVPKMRTTKGRTVAAEYSTDEPMVLEAIYADASYGKDFYEVGDHEGKKKTKTRVVTKSDTKLVALRGLFKTAGLEFDDSKPVDVLETEYQIHVIAVSGKKIGKSSAPEIPHIPVDVKADINTAAEAARNTYLDKYGEEVPEQFAGDLGFLSAVATDPDFDAKAYIAAKLKDDEESPDDATDSGGDPPEPTIEDLREEYRVLFSKNVPNPKKNDLAWIKGKIAEKK